MVIAVFHSAQPQTQETAARASNHTPHTPGLTSRSEHPDQLAVPACRYRLLPRCHVRSVAHLVCSTSYAVGVAACSTGTNSMTIELISSVPSLPAPSGMFAGMYCVEPAGVYCTPAVVDSSTIVPSGA